MILFACYQSDVVNFIPMQIKFLYTYLYQILNNLESRIYYVQYWILLLFSGELSGNHYVFKRFSWSPSAHAPPIASKNSKFEIKPKKKHENNQKKSTNPLYSVLVIQFEQGVYFYLNYINCGKQTL